MRAASRAARVGNGALADGGGFLSGEELGETVQLAAEVEGEVGGEGEVLELGAGELVVFFHASLPSAAYPASTRAPPPSPLLWLTCFNQKHAADELSTPSSAKWSSSLAPTGSLITGADCLNTFPPRSSTKWLCVATNANVIE